MSAPGALNRVSAALCLGTMTAASAAAPAPAEPRTGQLAPAPEGYATPKPTGQTDSFVFARVAGTMKHTIDRRTIESMCDTIRGVTPETPKPVFETGWDQPNTTESQVFTNATSRVSFTAGRVYVCSNQSNLSPAQLPCGCNYRFENVRSTTLRRVLGNAQAESVSIDHQRRTVRRTVVPVANADPADPGFGGALAAQWAPEVVGQDKVLDLPCTVRRKSLGGVGYMEWCITPDDASLVKDVRLRSRSLRHRKVAAGNEEIGTERTLQIVPDVLLDLAAFAVPEGYALQGPTSSKAKP